MPKITRQNQKIFGASAGLNQIAQFGSLAAGSPSFTTTPETIQALGNYLTGWFGAIIGSNSPAIEDMNALFYLYAYQLSYLMQTGVPEWNDETTYYIGSLATNSTGDIYKSKTDDNLNNILTNLTHWTPLVSDASPPVGSIIAYNPGYFTNTANAGFTVTGPAGNTVAQVNTYLPENWRVCDGAALNDPSSPIWVGAGRNLPNLTSSRFLRGATTAGGIGGQATITPTGTFAGDAVARSAWFAAGSYTPSGTNSGGAASFNRNTMDLQQNDHNHALDVGALGSTARASITLENNHIYIRRQSPGTFTVTHAIAGTVLTPVYSPSNNTTLQGDTGIEFVDWVSSTVTTSFTQPSFSGNAATRTDWAAAGNYTPTGTFTGNSVNIEPVYLNTFFIIRVK